MGLLDDAIKEHLELKRRHGADPTEVARLEHEALGPARREPAAAVAPVADDEPVDEDTALEDDRSVYEDDDYADEVPADERLEAPVREVQARAAAPAQPVTQPDEVAEPEPEPEAEARAEVDPEPEAAADVDQPTEQFSLQELEEASEDPREQEAQPEPESEPPEPPQPAPHADVVPADEEPESDDVLEETPEFLQETPEHDRLWFEQKPPRDFDF
jgi:hypothetical protein